MHNLPAKKSSSYILVSILFIIYLFNGLFYLRQQSPAYDEYGHLNFGIRIIRGNTSRSGDPTILNSKMPVSALNALPRAFEQLLVSGLKKTDNGFSDLMHGRYVTLLLSILTGLYVYWWSRDLYGEKAGIFSLFLFVFCPNCLAHAILVTTDSYSAFFLIAVLYHLWKYTMTGLDKDFLIFSAWTGAAQLVKQSLFHLYILIPLLLVIHLLAGADRRVSVKKVLWQTGVFILINILIINAGFYFQGFGTRLSEYHFISNLFQKVQTSLFFVRNIPVPLPHSFMQGLDMAKYYDEMGGGIPGSSTSNITLLGQSRTGSGFWYYYFVSFFYKTPIATLCFLFWSIVLLIKKIKTLKIFNNEAYLLLPVIYFFIVLDFFYKTQVGIRHIIFIYPLLYVFMGIVIKYLRYVWQQISVVALSCWYMISVLSYFGNYIPYTNEFILDKKMAYLKVGGFNLVFGMAPHLLNAYLSSHPDVFMATPVPRPGRQVIFMNDFLDVWNRHEFDWLKPFKPVGHIAHYYLIFDIKPGDINK